MSPENTPPSRALITAGAQLAPINPTTFDEVKVLAKLAVLSGLSCNKDDDETKAIAMATMAILQGLELGIPAMQAVQGIAIINGKAMIYGDLLTAVLWRHGFKVEKRIEGSGEIRCGYAKITRPDGTVIEKRFSIADARRARLWDEREKVRRKDRKGEWYDAPNDAPWYRFPERMLEWRAFGFACKDGASDVTRGMYVYEEMSPEANDPIDLTPSVGHNRGPALDVEIPDMGGAAPAPEASAESSEDELSNRQYLSAFRTTVRMTGGAGLDRKFWDAHKEEIVRRGLEDECRTIITEATAADVTEAEMGLAESEPEPEDDGKPDMAPEVARRLAKFGKELALCANPTRLRERWQAESGYRAAISPVDQAHFDAAYAQAVARVRGVKLQPTG